MALIFNGTEPSIIKYKSGGTTTELTKIIYNGVVVWEANREIIPSTSIFPYSYKRNGNYMYHVSDTVDINNEPVLNADGSSNRSAFPGDYYRNQYSPYNALGPIEDGKYLFRKWTGNGWAHNGTGLFSRSGYSKLKFTIHLEWSLPRRAIAIYVLDRGPDGTENNNYVQTEFCTYIVPATETFWYVYGYDWNGAKIFHDDEYFNQRAINYEKTEQPGTHEFTFDINLNNFYPNSNNINIFVSQTSHWPTFPGEDYQDSTVDATMWFTDKIYLYN